MAAAYTARVKDRLLRPVVGRRANAIVANSRAGLDYWASRARPSTILALVPNAVSFDQVCMVEPTEPLGLIAPGTPFILVVGRLSSEKNLGMLIDALALVSRELNVATIVCGDGPTRPELEAQIAANGLQERVFLVGIRRDVWGLMKQARALVNASVFEGHPNVVIEAAAAGCPLVLSDIAAHRAVLDHGCAAFFDPASPRGLADALLQTLWTPGIASERATRARNAVAALSVDHAVAGYQHVYDTLISRKR
jgi:glycosyltransferase involved in cell wall biosynthesis